MSGASKYAPLADLLAASGAGVIEMTFVDVDEVVRGLAGVGVPVPDMVDGPRG